MGILTKRTTWTVAKPADETRRASDLTPEEQANVRRALHVLRRRLGGYRQLGSAIRVKWTTLMQQGSRRAPSAGVAIRLARLAGVPADDVLTGQWPVEGACPHCGRT